MPHLPWMIFAPVEFIVIYLGGAIYFAGCIYVMALGGLARRASSLLAARFQTGRISCEWRKMAPLSLSEIAAARSEQGQERTASWLKLISNFGDHMRVLPAGPRRREAAIMSPVASRERARP